MAGCYNLILVPAAERELVVAAIADALQRLGCRIVHLEEPSTYAEDFKYRSAQMIVGGPPGNSSWVPLSAWGDGLSDNFPGWYRTNPLAKALSYTASPVIYIFTYDAGFVAGYSIFEEGKQVESISLTFEQELPLGEFAPPLAAPAVPTKLAAIVGDAKFDFEKFMRGFKCLEVGAAALASRLGASVHLVDPLDVQDGEGPLTVENGEYRRVSLSGWFAVFYEKDRA